MSTYSEEEVSRIIEMAWEDRTPFEAIENLYGLNSGRLVVFMRKHLAANTFKTWRKRHSGRVTKHQKLRHPEVKRMYCKTQYKPR